MTIDDHPKPETLLAYRADTLSADEDEAVREHLAECADCTGLVLELTDGEGAEDVTDAVSELDLERAWRRARTRLRPSAPSRPWTASPWRLALAASLVLALASPLLFFRGGDPDAARPIRLEPLDAARGSETPGPCAALLPGDRWRLALPARDAPAGADFRLDVLTAERRFVTARDLAEPAAGDPVVELDADALDPGRYLLYLVDRRPPEPVLIERFCIEIPPE